MQTARTPELTQAFAPGRGTPGRVLPFLACCTLSIALLGAPAAPAEAQRNPVDGTVRGQVLDARSEAPIVSATVDVLDAVGRIRARAVTDAEGSFFFGRLDPGSFRIRVRSLGYEEVTTPRWWVESGEVLDLVVRLDMEALLLAPLEVVARSRSTSPVLSGFYQRLERGLMGTFFSREDIEERAPMRITDLLIEIPGARLQSTAGSGDPRRDMVLTFGRSIDAGGGCQVQIYLDGQHITRGGVPVTVDEVATPGVLEGIEVYRGLSSVPAEFLSPEARCGVVALWTRRGG